MTAYAVLLSEPFGRPVPEGRIRYHASNKTVRVAVDDAALERLRLAVARAQELSLSLERPPVTDNENLCAKCSLAPVCLPEESRLAAAVDVADDTASLSKPRRLFPKDAARRVLHVVDRDAQVRRAGLQLVVRNSKGEEKKFPGMDVGAIILHGSAQITSQAIHFAAANDIAVHWISGGGWYVGGVALRVRSVVCGNTKLYRTAICGCASHVAWRRPKWKISCASSAASRALATCERR